MCIYVKGYPHCWVHRLVCATLGTSPLCLFRQNEYFSSTIKAGYSRSGFVGYTHKSLLLVVAWSPQLLFCCGLHNNGSGDIKGDSKFTLSQLNENWLLSKPFQLLMGNTQSSNWFLLHHTLFHNLINFSSWHKWCYLSISWRLHEEKKQTQASQRLHLRGNYTHHMYR